jgi:enediyne biosynthesis protein E7
MSLIPTRPPGPRGEHSGIVNYEAWQADIFGFLRALAARYGDVVGFDLGRSPCILVNGASQVRELLFEREACLRKPEFVKDSNRGHWGDGLTTLEGSAWRAHRQALRPSFRPRPVSDRLPIVAECAGDTLDAWGREPKPDQVIDLARELRILTARIAARVVLDAELEGYGPSEGRSGMVPFDEAYGEDYASAPGGDPAGPLVMVRPRAPQRMDTVIRIIDSRIASGEGRGDVLSDLVQARLPDGGGLTRDEIVGEVVQMLYAGHLTVPSSLVHLWRDIDDNDLNAIAADADRLCAGGVPGLFDLLESYCLAALKESMRLHPPAPILYREVESAFELGGFEFACDAGVWVSPQLLHSDPRHFPEPHRFLPERFMRGGSGATLRSVYLPFGAGPRACIGANLALLQMTLISLLVARRFRLVPVREESGSFRVQPRADYVP